MIAPSPLMGEGWDEGDTPHLTPLPQGERKPKMGRHLELGNQGTFKRTLGGLILLGSQAEQPSFRFNGSIMVSGSVSGQQWIPNDCRSPVSIGMRALWRCGRAKQKTPKLLFQASGVWENQVGPSTGEPAKGPSGRFCRVAGLARSFHFNSFIRR